jgi:hypothetical protein
LAHVILLTYITYGGVQVVVAFYLVVAALGDRPGRATDNTGYAFLVYIK